MYLVESRIPKDLGSRSVLWVDHPDPYPQLGGFTSVAEIVAYFFTKIGNGVSNKQALLLLWCASVCPIFGRSYWTMPRPGAVEI